MIDLLTAILLAVGLALAAVLGYGIVTAIIVVTGLSSFFLFIRRPELGLILLVAEIVLGGTGHYIEFPLGISLRQAIFFAAIAGWIFRKVTSPQAKLILPPKEFIIAIAILFTCILCAALNGSLRGNKGIYEEAITWAYLVLAFVFSDVINTPQKMNRLVKWFLMVAVVLAVLQILLLIGFMMGVLPVAPIASTWPRTNIRISLEAGGFYRIFFNGSIFYQIAISVFLSLLVATKSIPRKTILICSGLCLTALILGLTRGMWVGLAISLFFLLVMVSFKKKIKVTKLFVIASALSILALILWQGSSGVLALLDKAKGFTDVQNDMSISFKIEETKQLLNAILENFVLGTGFGIGDYGGVLAERIYFHNSFLQFWLKTGFFGIMILFAFLWVIINQGYRVIQTTRDNLYRSLVLGFWVGLIGTLFTTMLNPFIGTPMGLTYLSLFIAMLRVYGKGST